MNEIKFSIIIVSLNAGNDLVATVNSIIKQDYEHFEVIIKDGNSNDGSLEFLPNDKRIRLIEKKDDGIYHAMNQALEYITGDYVIYLNCGDTFFSVNVLSSLSKNIFRNENSNIYYGDNYTEMRSVILLAPKKINNLVLFNRILCHQSTIYNSAYIKNKKFDSDYKIAADVNFYISAYKKDNVTPMYLPVVVSSYKGGGFSESPVNRKLGLFEHKKILRMNFNIKEYFYYRFIQLITLKLLKQWISKQSYFAKYYNQFASIYYKNMNKRYD